LAAVIFLSPRLHLARWSTGAVRFQAVFWNHATRMFFHYLMHIWSLWKIPVRFEFLRFNYNFSYALTTYCRNKAR